jgi:hypothetical protein
MPWGLRASTLISEQSGALLRATEWAQLRHLRRPQSPPTGTRGSARWHIPLNPRAHLNRHRGRRGFRSRPRRRPQPYRGAARTHDAKRERELRAILRPVCRIPIAASWPASAAEAPSSNEYAAVCSATSKEVCRYSTLLGMPPCFIQRPALRALTFSSTPWTMAGGSR